MIPKTHITPKMADKLEALTHDHMTPIYRSGPYGERILKALQPWWVGLISSSEASRRLAPVLLEAEEKYTERIPYPKSIFKADVFKEECIGLGAARTKAATHGNEVDIRRNLFKTELKTGLVSFELRPNVATKSSGAPDFITKRQWFASREKQNFIDELERTIQRGRQEIALGMVYAAFSGTRTQQAREYEPPNNVIPKVRTVNMIPAEEFREQFRVIAGLIEKARTMFDMGKQFPIFNYYRPFSDTAQAFANLSSKARCIIIRDYKGFDHWVRREETEADFDAFCEDSPEMVHCKLYQTRAPLIHPWGINWRTNGDGRQSGDVSTNIWDSTDNVADGCESERAAGFPKPIAIFVNGDDKMTLYSELIQESMLKKEAQYSYHVLEPDKSSIRSDGGAFYCKRAWWVENGKGRQARPIALAINSLAFTERDSSIVSAGKEHTYVATGNIVADVGKDHPYWDEFAAKVRSLQKYHLADLDKDRLKEAAMHYASGKWNPENDEVSERADKFIIQAEEILG